MGLDDKVTNRHILSVFTVKSELSQIKDFRITPMQYRTFGKAGVKVSALVLA